MTRKQEQRVIKASLDDIGVVPAHGEFAVPQPACSVIDKCMKKLGHIRSADGGVHIGKDLIGECRKEL